MGGQCLYCDLCGGEFSSKSEWNEHLVDDQHLNVSRARWRKFLSDECCRTTSALVLASFEISRESGLEVIKKFSERVLDYVVDFVWWEECSCRGVIQFESRRKLEEIMTRLEGGTDATVNGNLVQLRKASEILKLEWPYLLFGESEETVTPVQRHQELPNSSKLVIHPSSIIRSPNTCFQGDWNSICSSIELTETECSTVLQIISDLTELFRRHHHPACEVILFHNFFLRMQNPMEANNVVLLFVYIPPSPSNPKCNIVSINESSEAKVLNSPEFAMLFPRFKRTTFSPFHYIKSSRFIHRSSQFMFNLSSKPTMVGEAYLARLTLYLAQFDPRLKGVLTLVRFWARAHKIQIAENDTSIQHFHDVAPDPFPLDWLVILFLIREKVVPSVRMVTDRPHPPLIICNLRGHGHDIGFSTDMEFVQTWNRDRKVPQPGTDEFITSVVTLTRDIFTFYSSQLKEGCWLVNPKDGELIKREGTRCRKSSLSSKEIEMLTSVEESEKHRFPEKFKITLSRISLLNPLVLTWRLSFCDDRWTNLTCHQMEAAASRLTTFLEHGGSLQEAIVGGIHNVEQVQLELQCEKSQRLRSSIVTKRTSSGGRGSGAKRPRNF